MVPDRQHQDDANPYPVTRTEFEELRHEMRGVIRKLDEVLNAFAAVGGLPSFVTEYHESEIRARVSEAKRHWFERAFYVVVGVAGIASAIATVLLVGYR